MSIIINKHAVKIKDDEGVYQEIPGLGNNPTPASIGAIAAPETPETGQFLKWNGTAWVAATLPLYNGGVSNG